MTAVAKPAPSKGTAITLTLLAALALAIIIFVRVPSPGNPLSPSSTSSNGTHALAEILRDHGMTVEEISPDQARDLASPDVTFVVDHSAYTEPYMRQELIDSRATIVLLTNVDYEEWGFDGKLLNLDGARLRAQCDDPDAMAAASIGPISWLFVPDGAESGCFPANGGYVWTPQADTPHLSYLADDSILTNEYLDVDGNAAFALRKLGANPKLYWVVGGTDPHQEPKDRRWIGLPDWFFPLVSALTLSLGWWVIYRGRRFGKLVAEPLPVVVPASEVTEGRAILYQRGKNHAHAARALRAGTIMRLSRGRGISDDANPDVVVSTLANASGYPPAKVADLLYERPVSGDSDLIEIAAELERFERDING
ncbi:hypothetical protein J2S70_000544 [Trueperella bonasi]|uniref:DUF4350 domain-containing protein n=1 Tax=Trueperella bonasi TaxID=312286 RepID=A0ABT9NFH6_9ACTO|nr:DUF4350 domain-containing protein [Trueperella bonasi]MDP9805962.1 hypothetical protein [Trueperella bonasi]